MRWARWVERFWSIAGAVSIRVKVMGIVIGLILTLGAAVTVLLHRGLTTTLERELEERGVAIAVNLASRSQEPVLTDSLITLYTLANETVRNNKGVLYVYVTDRHGQVLVHTFDRGIPEDLLTLPPITAGARHSVVQLHTETAVVQSISAPILSGRAGAVHVGISTSEMQAIIAGHIQRIVAITSAVLVLGGVLAFAVATILTRPLAQLAAAAEAVGRGDFTWRPPRWARDEIGRLGASFARMQERLAHFREELRRHDEARSRLLEQIITAQEEERRRIARELHDETGQSLTTLVVGLTTIAASGDLGAVRERARELRSVAARTLEEVHNLSRGLRPSVLDDLGLLAALERYLNEYGVSHGLAVDLHARGLDGQRLPGPVETAVYRIVQEALTNTAKHAHATAVSVLVERRDGSLHLIVEDDGRGFEVDGVLAAQDIDRRLGLHGMRERTALLGGSLTVESAPGHGTTIFVEVPLASARG
ncbi:MAG: HAMP domain-containing protein [Candidatus Rokubacteria bacterium]|nr:HAMP domain-containing protein [Candidatus Rokubacteria bacterium]